MRSHRYDTLTRNRHIPAVHEDPRTDEKAKAKVNFHDWEQLNSDNLYCYSIIINKILSPTFGTPLEVLQNALIYQHAIPSSIVEKFIKFISINDLKKISWETPETNKDVRIPRISKNKFIDVNAAYKDLKSWQHSENYRNVNIAKNLLNNAFDVTESQLSTTLKNNHNLTNDQCQLVSKNLGNERDVEIRRGTFDNIVRLRKKSY